MEALVSARTDLLDSNPTVDVRCTLPAESCDVLHEPDAMVVTEFALSQNPATLDIDTGSPHALSFRLAQSQFVFAQMLPAADVVHAELASESVTQTITSTVSFFGGRIEKGVIRRARLRAFLAPSPWARRMGSRDSRNRVKRMIGVRMTFADSTRRARVGRLSPLPAPRQTWLRASDERQLCPIRDHYNTLTNSCE